MAQNPPQADSLETYFTLQLHGQDLEFINGQAELPSTVIVIQEITEGSFSCTVTFEMPNFDSREISVVDQTTPQNALDAAVAACAADPGDALLADIATLAAAVNYMATGA